MARPPTAGWPEALFVDRSDLGTCCVCFEVMRDAVIHVDELCGKSFCANCVKENGMFVSTCPTCRGAASWAPNRDLREGIMNRQVRCSSRLDDAGNLRAGEGCTWQGTLGSLAEHEAKECEFTLVECQYQKDLGCECALKPRREVFAYFHTQAQEHLRLAIAKGKRAREEEMAAEEMEDGAIEEAATAVEQEPQVAPAAEAQEEPQQPISSACHSLEGLLSSTAPSDLDAINEGLRSLVGLLPSSVDETEESAWNRALVSEPILAYAGRHAIEVEQYQHGRQTRHHGGGEREVKAERARLCRELRLKVSGPAGRSYAIELG